MTEKRSPEAKERRRKYVRQWYLKNRQHCIERARWKVTGWSPTEYAAAHRAQKGCCAICFRHESELGKKLNGDHDSIRQKTRMLLCDNCNIGLGHFGHSIDRLMSAAAYLEIHK